MNKMSFNSMGTAVRNIWESLLNPPKREIAFVIQALCCLENDNVLNLLKKYKSDIPVSHKLLLISNIGWRSEVDSQDCKWLSSVIKGDYDDAILAARGLIRTDPKLSMQTFQSILSVFPNDQKFIYDAARSYLDMSPKEAIEWITGDDENYSFDSTIVDFSIPMWAALLKYRRDDRAIQSFKEFYEKEHENDLLLKYILIGLSNARCSSAIQIAREFIKSRPLSLWAEGIKQFGELASIDDIQELFNLYKDLSVRSPEIENCKNSHFITERKYAVAGSILRIAERNKIQFV